MNRQEIKFKNFVWVDLENPSEADLTALSLPFEIDENFLEDSLEPGHLPKFERVKDYVFIIFRAYSAEPGETAIEVGEISNKVAFFVHEKGLLTIHRAPFNFLKPPDDSVETSEELVLYIVNDILLTYEKPIKIQSAKMDSFEREIFLKHGTNLSIQALYFEKSKARLTKKILQITQNVIGQFRVNENLESNLQDLKDTTLNLLLQSDEIIEDTNSLLNSYLSVTTQKSNDVMKLLTVFSAFFLPLTFIAGVYGMNFKNMPELNWKYGYFASLLVMAAIAGIIYWWFKRRRIM